MTNYEFWNNMQLLRKYAGQAIEPVCQKWGLTHAEMEVLLFLANFPEADRAADIVELRGLTKSHVSLAAKALVERGFLEIRQDETDHRVQRLKPSNTALEAIKEGQECQRAHIMALFEDFTPQELDQFWALQKKLFDALKVRGEG